MAINYDMPTDADSYLHRVGRAGRFGTKGLAISFVSQDPDKDVLQDVGKRFEVAIPYVPPPPGFPFISCAPSDQDHSEFPKEGIDASTYMAS